MLKRSSKAPLSYTSPLNEDTVQLTEYYCELPLAAYALATKFLNRTNQKQFLQFEPVSLLLDRVELGEQTFCIFIHRSQPWHENYHQEVNGCWAEEIGEVIPGGYWISGFELLFNRMAWEMV